MMMTWQVRMGQMPAPGSAKAAMGTAGGSLEDSLAALQKRLTELDALAVEREGQLKRAVATWEDLMPTVRDHGRDRREEDLYSTHCHPVLRRGPRAMRAADI